MSDVALFIPSLDGGGAEKVIVTLANNMVEKGYKVDLIVCRVGGVYTKKLSKNIKVVNLNVERVLFSIFPLVKYLKAEKPKALLSAMNYVNVIAIISKYLSGINSRLVISEHSNFSSSFIHNESLKIKIIKVLMGWLYNKADAIVVVSNGVGKDLIENLNILPDKVKTIYNPVVTPELLALKEKSVSNSWLNNKYPFILGVGRLTKAKNFSLLIRSFAKIESSIDSYLVILGEGELESELKKLIKELNIEHKVIMPGFVDNPYIWMKNAQVFVLSSLWEGFGNVIVEAMACGTKIISTDCPSGPAEILEDGFWGKLVQNNDVDALAKGILEMVNNQNSLFNSSSRCLDFASNKITDEYISTLINN